MVEKTVRMNLLFDFYGQLLTDRQRRFFDMYYAEDLSLGEIAEHFDVSRQAVYDILKRSAKALESFDERLGLIAQHQERAARMVQLLAAAEAAARLADQLALPDDDRQRLAEHLGQVVAHASAVAADP